MDDLELLAIHGEYERWLVSKGFRTNDFERFLLEKRMEEDAIRWRYLQDLNNECVEIGEAFILASAPYEQVLEAYDSQA